MSEKCGVNRPCRILDLLGYEYQEPQLLRILLHSGFEAKCGAPHFAPLLPNTHLLIEVDSRCDFTRHFLHLKSEEPPKNKVLVLTARACRRHQPWRMADACPGISPSKLVRINTLYIRDETYTKARAQIVNYHHELAFAGNFGQGTTSSSGAQRFRAGGRGEATGRINPRYWPHTG